MIVSDVNVFVVIMEIVVKSQLSMSQMWGSFIMISCTPFYSNHVFLSFVVIQTLPMLHMARRDWFDDDQLLEDDGDFEGFDEHNDNQEDDEGGITSTKSTMNGNNNLNDELF